MKTKPKPKPKTGAESAADKYIREYTEKMRRRELAEALRKVADLIEGGAVDSGSVGRNEN